MVGVNFITATPTLSLNVFFKKVDSGIALTRVLLSTGIGVHGGLRDSTNFLGNQSFFELLHTVPNRSEEHTSELQSRP